MPNILISTACNLSCDYCFAIERLKNIPKRHMPMENVIKVIDFLKHSNYSYFRIMGGEPTLHPHFEEIIKTALNEGMHVDLLSNCTWPDKFNKLFIQISPSCLSFLLNINHPDNYNLITWDRIKNNLSYLANRPGVSLSFNIFEKEPKYQYVLELAKMFSIPNIRLSFSLPVLDFSNHYLRLEQYKELVPFIIDFVDKGEENGVKISLDNVVPLCIFNYEQLGELVLKRVLDLNRNVRCEPIIDIGPDLSIWNCFCLSNFNNRHLDNFQNLNEAIEYYRKIIKPYQDNIFPMKECYECPIRMKWGCQGGCINFSIEKEKESNLFSKRKTVEWNDEANLTFPNDVNIIRYSFPAKSIILSNVKTGARAELGLLLGQYIYMLDGNHKAGDILHKLLKSDYENLNGSLIDAFELEIKEESIRNIFLGLANEGLIEFKN